MIDEEAKKIRGILKVGDLITSNVNTYKVIDLDHHWVITSRDDGKTINIPAYKILRGIENNTISLMGVGGQND